MKRSAQHAVFLILFAVLPFLLQAKNRSEITIETTGRHWYNSPLFWLAAALFFTFLLILVLRSGRKPEKEAPAEKD
jgi:fucose 4-O-acetylase-like acetyltransferase